MAQGASAADEYESFIAALIADVRQSGRDIRDLHSGRLNRISGASGQAHQMDVSFIDASFERPTLVLIECKRRKDPIILEHVKVAHATLMDITAAPDNLARGLAIIVSTHGAGAGALRYAAHYGIRLETVRHGPDYGFRYENVILHGLSFGAVAEISFTPEVIRQCRCCTCKFVAEENEEVCPVCTALLR